MQVKQKDAVYQAVKSVLSENGTHFEDGMNVESILTDEQSARVSDILLEGFSTGTIVVSKEYSPKELRSYVAGLKSNWLRKDTRLNGGIQYVAKNPGSRAGAGDEQLKALRAVLSTKTDETERAEIQTFIDKRLAEIASTKVKKVSINFDALPEELRNKLQG